MEIYSKIWNALNQVNLEILDRESIDYPKSFDEKQVIQYFRAQKEQIKTITLSSLTHEDKDLLENAGLSLDYLNLNEKLITPNGVYQEENQTKNLETRQQLAVENGYIYAVCPWTGNTLKSNFGLSYVLSIMIAYRFVSNQVFYLVYYLSLDSSPCLYFPDQKLLVILQKTRALTAKLAQEHIELFQSLVVSSWREIQLYLLNKEKPKTVALLELDNIYHYLSQLLLGIYRLSETDSLHYIDLFLNISPDYFAPIEKIFTEIKLSKVIRGIELQKEKSPYLLNFWREEVLKNNYFIVRTDSDKVMVDEKFSQKIINISFKQCSPDFLNEVKLAQKKYFPLLFITVRLGKRKWLSQSEGIANIINYIAKYFPDLGVVFDGVSRTSTGYEANKPASIGNPDTTEELITKEKLLVNEISSLISRNIAVYDTVGCFMHESIVWANSIDLYLAPAGTGLFKVVWMADKPGVVHGNSLTRSVSWSEEIARVKPNSIMPVLVPKNIQDIIDVSKDEARKYYIDYDFDWKFAYEELLKIASSIERERK